jgi:hypothetical protein
VGEGLEVSEPASGPFTLLLKISYRGLLARTTWGEERSVEVPEQRPRGLGRGS